MTLQYALLGLISSTGPVSGYDLTKMFRWSMSHYWYARHGQIYPLLEKMRRQGLIVCQHVRQKVRPNKKLYSITPKGTDALLDWLRLPRKPIQMKNEGLLKTRFFAHLPAAEAMCQMREEREAYKVLLERYRLLEEMYFPDGPDGCASADLMYTYFTLKRGIMFLEDSIAWCDWCMGAMQRRFATTGTVRRRRRAVAKHR